MLYLFGTIDELMKLNDDLIKARESYDKQVAAATRGSFSFFFFLFFFFFFFFFFVVVVVIVAVVVFVVVVYHLQFL